LPDSGRTGSIGAFPFLEQRTGGCSDSEEDDEEGENLSHDGSSREGWLEPVADREKGVADEFRLEDGAANGGGPRGVTTREGEGVVKGAVAEVVAAARRRSPHGYHWARTTHACASPCYLTLESSVKSCTTTLFNLYKIINRGYKRSFSNLDCEAHISVANILLGITCPRTICYSSIE
jgi:hypothetical protein